MLGKTLRGHYTVIQELGEGAFGKTYLAKDRDLRDSLCAVKQFKPKNVTSSTVLGKARELFEREAKALYQLGTHDQIPRLLAHFEEEQEFYLVQEFVDGHALVQELFDDKRLSEVQLIELLQEILKILAFVHQKNVIHRDIKPSNLMRQRKDQKIVLIDFGAVKQIGFELDNSQTVIGTPGYMPPEQKDGKPEFCSDIYAVGVLGIQALTGLPASELQIDRDPWTGERTIIWRNQAQVSAKLADILDKMVRLDARERYQSVIEALQALQQLTQPPLSLWQRMGRLLDISLNQAPAPSIPANAVPLPPPVLSQVPPSKREQIANTYLQLELPMGQVDLDSAFYVERPPIESSCYAEIIKPGALIRVKAPRQMGKTSLMTRILHQATQQGYRTVSLNFQLADAEFLTNLEQFLQWFCASITDVLNLPDKLAEHWKGVLGSKNKCTNYFQRYLLSEITSPLALGLDEVDQIFQHPEIATDFFALLRAWHEKSKNEPVWKKLRLVIVHSKEVYIPLNINQSPFNVGLPIELPELNQVQVQDLVQRHRLNWSEQQVEQLMAILGGHPYLVRVALYQIASERMTLEELLEVAPTEEGPYYDHLRRHLLNLEKDADLVSAITKVVAAGSPVPIGTAEAFKLRSMGLVKFHGNAVMPLCEMYRQYFRDRLGNPS